jgi:hypothetical protein
MAKAPAILSLEDFTESINMCIYADSGIGKTVLAGTAKTLFLAFASEKGTISAKRQGSTAKVWKINTWNDLQDAHDWIELNPSVFDWVCIDSVTAMQKLCMRGILDAAVAENHSRDLDIPALHDWQKYYNMFDRFIVAFNDLPVNVLYTATVMQNENEEGENIVMPNLAGKGSGYSISQAFCASLAVVGYLKKIVVGKGEDAHIVRKILFENMPPHFAKDRYDVFPRWVTTSDDNKQIQTLAGLTKMIEGSGSPVRATPARRAPLRAAK